MKNYTSKNFRNEDYIGIKEKVIGYFDRKANNNLVAGIAYVGLALLCTQFREGENLLLDSIFVGLPFGLSVVYVRRSLEIQKINSLIRQVSDNDLQRIIDETLK